jgi:hypothetical protein
MLFKSKIVCISFIYVVMFKSCAVYQKNSRLLDETLTSKKEVNQNWWSNQKLTNHKTGPIMEY